MKSIDEIRQQLQLGKFEFTRHGLKRLVERNISRLEIMETGKNAIIIEEGESRGWGSKQVLLG